MPPVVGGGGEAPSAARGGGGADLSAPAQRLQPARTRPAAHAPGTTPAYTIVRSKNYGTVQLSLR